jgi:hypothetical protein
VDGVPLCAECWKSNEADNAPEAPDAGKAPEDCTVCNGTGDCRDEDGDGFVVEDECRCCSGSGRDQRRFHPASAPPVVGEVELACRATWRRCAEDFDFFNEYMTEVALAGHGAWQESQTAEVRALVEAVKRVLRLERTAVDPVSDKLGVKWDEGITNLAEALAALEAKP